MHVRGFTTAALTSFLLPLGGIGSQRRDTLGLQLITRWLAELQTAPHHGLLQVFAGQSNCCALVFVHFVSEAFVDPVYTADTFRAILGSNSGDPDFIETLAIGTPGLGTVIGTSSALTRSDSTRRCARLACQACWCRCPGWVTDSRPSRRMSRYGP